MAGLSYLFIGLNRAGEENKRRFTFYPYVMCKVFVVGGVTRSASAVPLDIGGSML